jgi:hypothetical protein
MWKLTFILVLFAPGPVLHALQQTADTTISLFRDRNLSLQDSRVGYSVQSDIWSESDNATTVSVQGSYIAYRNQDDPGVAHPMGLHQSIDSRNVQINLTQQIATKYSLGLSLGYSDTIYESLEEEADGNEFGAANFGVNGSAWLLRETLRVSLGYGNSTFEQVALDTSAGTGERIILPPEVDTHSYSLRVLQMLTTSTILQYGGSATTRSDRPDIYGADLEVRQYVDALKGSFYVGGQYYHNVGFLSNQSFDGNISAFALNAKFNKKLGQKWIASTGYRYYREKEEARDEFTSSTQRGSDYVFVGGRYRFDGSSWTESSSEVFAQTGYYASNLPSKGVGFSLGIQFKL